MITRDNYEIFFIDYFDGNLSDADISCLFDFLDKNEDLKQEFLAFEEVNVSISEPPVKFEFKNELKQIDSETTFSEDVFDAFAVGFIENDLSKKQSEELLSAINKNEKLETELNFYKSTKLVANENIIFENKDELKKKAIIINFAPLRYVAAAAAILLLFFSVYKFQENSNRFAEYNPRKEIKTYVAGNDTEEEFVYENIVKQKKYQVKNQIIKEESTQQSSKYQEVVAEIKKESFNKIEVKKAKSITQNISNPNVDIAMREVKQTVKNSSTSDNKTTVLIPISAKDLALNFVKEKIFKQEHPEKEKLSLWMVADAGVEQLNKMTKNTISFHREVSEKGKVKSFSLFAGNFGIEKK